MSPPLLQAPRAKVGLIVTFGAVGGAGLSSVLPRPLLDSDLSGQHLSAGGASVLIGIPSILMMACLGMFGAAAVYDVASRNIPNVIPLVLLVLGGASRFWAGDLLGSIVAGGVVFVAGTVCWLMGWLGGGDVKLLGAGAVAVPLRLVPSFLLWVGLAGGVLALIYLAGRRCVPEPTIVGGRGRLLPCRVWRVECWRIRRGGPLPYAVAIAAAGMLALVQGASS